MPEDSNAAWADRLTALENEILALPPAQRAEALRRAGERLSPEDFQALGELLKHAPTTPSPPAATPAATTPSQPFFQTEFLGWLVRPASGPEYRVADFYHAGGMATVWRLERREPADDHQWPPVLLCKTPKTLTPDPAPDPASAATQLAAAQAKHDHDFLAEAERLQVIQHPQVIRVLATATLRPPAPDGVLGRMTHWLAAAGRPCFLMEFPPGSERLYDWMDRQRAQLPPVEFARQLVALLRAVTGILADLQHRHSLVHGDLSGGNILIVGGQPRLIDFGLAQVVREHRNGFAAHATQPGTPGFAPPEQRVDAQLHRTSDAYSVAAGLVCGLTNAAPDKELHPYLFSDQPERFRNLPAEDLCAWLTGRIVAHGLRQRLLQQRALLLDLLAGTLIADSQRRLEMPRLTEKLAALESLLAAKHWDADSLAFPAIPHDRPLYGRAGVLQEIAEFFRHAGPGPVIVLLQGLGGVGKTAICEKYLHCSRPHPQGGGDGAYPAHPHYEAILWSTACDELTFENGIRTYCQTLRIADARAAKGELQLRFRTYLERHPGCLWVINNLDESGPSADWLTPWLPSAGTCHLLITSRPKAVRIPGLAGRAGLLEKHLDPLPEDVALEYLCRRGRRENLSDREHRFARQIVGREGLDGLPLAIELAAAYLAVTPHRSLEQYWELLQKSVAFLDTEFATARDHAGRTGKESLRSVGAAWQPLFELMERDHPAAAALLRLSAVLPADDLPFELLTPTVAWPDDALQKLLAQPDALLREDALCQQLRVLDQHSLIEWNPQARTWSIHRLVQRVVRDSLPETQGREWELAAADAVRRAFAAVDFTNATNLPSGRRLFPAFGVARMIWETRGAEFQPGELATAWDAVGGYCYFTAQFRTGEDCFRRALTIDETGFEPNPPNVARDLNNLAQLLKATNRLAEAEPLMRRALAIDEQSYGAEHPKVAIRLNNLAQLLQATNRLAEAEPLYCRAMEINEKAYPPDHPAVGLSCACVAHLLQDTNRLAEAEPLLRRALAIDEQSYGAEHPDVATNLNNLGQLLQATNRLAEAEPLLRRCMAILRNFRLKHGHEHPRWKKFSGNYNSLLTASGLSLEEGGRRIEVEIENRQCWAAMTPEVERLLAPVPTVAEVLAKLDEQYRREGRPPVWFLPLTEPISPHLASLLGPINGHDGGAQEKP